MYGKRGCDVGGGDSGSGSGSGGGGGVGVKRLILLECGCGENDKPEEGARAAKKRKRESCQKVGQIAIADDESARPFFQFSNQFYREILIHLC